MRVELMLCCNNENGNFTGKIVEMELYHKFDLLAYFEAANDDSICKCSILKNNIIKLDNLKLKSQSYTSYAGNIMWDKYEILPREANRLWKYLLTIKEKVSMQEGSQEFWNAWQYKLPVDFERLEG